MLYLSYNINNCNDSVTEFTALLCGNKRKMCFCLTFAVAIFISYWVADINAALCLPERRNENELFP